MALSNREAWGAEVLRERIDGRVGQQLSNHHISVQI